jgi:tight adherence protein B
MTPLALVLGACLGAGLYLCCAARLWPRDAQRSTQAHAGSRARVISWLSAHARALHLSSGAFLAMSSASGVCAALIAQAIWGVTGLTVALSLTALGAPTLVASGAIDRSASRSAAQWSDTIDTIVSSLRAGASIPQAVAALSASSLPWISTPAATFGRLYLTSGNFGLSLDELKREWAHPVGDRLVETLRLAREIGSAGTTRVLSELADQVRAERATRAELQARQGWIRIAAIIGLVAPWAVLALLGLRAETAAVYNSALGLCVIAVGGVISVVAFQLMRSLAVLPQEERWLA